MELNDKIVIYRTEDGQTAIDVKLEQDTVWLSANQMSTLFDRDEKTIRKHINNVFAENELERENNTHFLRVDGVKQPVAFYSLDVIISVGYRVKSKRGVAFRKWATSVLNDYLLKGYAENRRLLEAQGKTIELQSRMIAHLTETDETELLYVINRYTEALDLLDDYDHQCLVRPKGSKEYVQLSYEECKEIINSMKFGLSSDVFGTEKTKGELEGILGSVYQSVFGEDVYPTVEEKAATLLYFLIKDYPLTAASV